MKRVFSIIHAPFFGGPHNQVLRLAAPLASDGWHTTVLLPDEPGPAQDVLSRAGIDVRLMPLSRLRALPDPVFQARYVAAFRRDVRRLRGLFRSERPDAVMLHGLVNSQAALAARAEGIPVVWQILDTRTPAPLVKLLVPLVKRTPGAIMSTGLAVAEAHGVSRTCDRLVSYFPPVDTELFAPREDDRRSARRLLDVPEDALLVGTLGNITPQKRHEALIDAAGELRASGFDGRFVVLGAEFETQPEYFQLVHDRIAERGLAGSFDVRDPGNQVSLLLQALDVFVLSSGPHSEGIPTAMLEAMSTGVPVVATDVGAVPEAVEHGVSGLVVQPDPLPPMVDALREITQDDGLRARLARNARERAVALFSIEACALAHLRALRLAVSLGKH